MHPVLHCIGIGKHHLLKVQAAAPGHGQACVLTRVENLLLLTKIRRKLDVVPCEGVWHDFIIFWVDHVQHTLCVVRPALTLCHWERDVTLFWVLVGRPADDVSIVRHKALNRVAEVLHVRQVF